MRATLIAVLAATFSIAACAPAGAGAAGGGFEDPAPPEVHDTPGGEPAGLKENPRASFRAKPKSLTDGAVASDWPDFMGPSRNMVSTETELVRALGPETPTLLWEMQKGTSYSSPAIAGDRLLYLHRDEGEERVVCLDPETGELYWEFSYATDFSDRYGYNNGPRSTPVIDGDRVYTYGAKGQLHSLDLATGSVLWKRDLASEFKVPQDFFGNAQTPLLEDDRLIINVGAPGGPTVAAFDKMNGKMLWGAGTEWGPSYASPVSATVHGKRRVFVFAGGESRPPNGGLLSIDPANGKIDFAFPWRSRTVESVNAATPVVIGDKVLVSATYRTGAALIQIKPDFTHELVWTSDEFDLHWTTAIEHEGYLYAFAGRNEPDAGLVCLDLKTGKTVWREVLEWQETVELNGQARDVYESPYRGSIMKVDGRFLALGEHGHLMWLDLSPKGGKIVSRSTLFLARESWSPPVISRGLLYVCQNTKSFEGKPPRLLCYDLRK